MFSGATVDRYIQAGNSYTEIFSLQQENVADRRYVAVLWFNSIPFHKKDGQKLYSYFSLILDVTNYSLINLTWRIYIPADS